jgi:PAS domain-containing protein
MEIIGEDESFPATPQAWTSRIHPDDWQAFRNTRDEIISGKASHFETEYRVRHRDGDGYGSGTEGGTLHRLISSTIEITARKQAQDALRKSASHLRALGRDDRAARMAQANPFRTT